MRGFVLVLSCLLLAGGPALAATPERAALLQRLSVALPPVGKGDSLGAQLAKSATDKMSPLNPGRDADIRRVAEAYGACGDKLMDLDAAQALVLRGIDRGMTDQEIRTLAEFYEGAGYRELLALADKAAQGQLDAEGMKRLQALAGTPEFAKLMEVMIAEVTSYTSTPAFTDGVQACATQYRAAAGKAGLKLD